MCLIEFMPINASPEYYNAEKKYLEAQTTEEKITCLEALIRVAPKHKSSENLLAGLRLRLKKLKEKQERSKKLGKVTRKGIKKEHFQCVLVGLPNSGKSSILARLTNARPLIANYFFSTSMPEIGTMDYGGVKAQIVDLPAIGSENFDFGIVNTADCLLIVVEKLEDLDKVNPIISKAIGARILVLNKADLLSADWRRKIEATMRSRKLSGILVSAETGENIEELKEMIFMRMKVIRIYTKEPGKPATKEPIVLPENSTVKKVAESILKGFSSKIKETKITGPSSKFPNQIVGLSHICKDLDIVEFHTR